MLSLREHVHVVICNYNIDKDLKQKIQREILVNFGISATEIKRIFQQTYDNT